MGESPGKMYALAIFLTLLATTATVLRYYARYLKKNGYSWDDFLIFLALVCTFVTGVLMIVGAAAGALGRHTTFDEQQEQPVFDHRSKILMQVAFAVQIVQVLTFAFTKLSVLFFYKRIFQGTLIRAAVWTNVGIITTWLIGFFFSNLFQCWPMYYNWGPTWGASGYARCVDTNMMFLAQAYSDIFTDLLILALPIPCIWAMTMPVKHKLAVSGIFLLGLLTVCSGIAKVIVFNRVNAGLHDGDSDISILITPTVYWPMIESALGIVGACLPLMRPLFSRGGPPTPKGFGQVRNLQSIRLDWTDDSMPEMKPWGSESEQGSQFGKNESKVSITQLIPSALPPMQKLQLKEGGFLQDQRPKTRRRDDENV